MKRLLPALLALSLSLCLTTHTALATEIWDLNTPTPSGEGSSYVIGSVSSVGGGLNNFKKVRSYAPGVYADVPAQAWYEENLRTVYELGLTEDAAAFTPGGRLTLREAVSLAVRLNRTYNNWSAPGLSDLQYALNMGIVGSDDYNDYNVPATRRSFAAIMAKALPGEALHGINAITDGAIPDVSMSDPGAAAIYALYRAGVLLGVDVQGTFRPDNYITRATAAVALSRMVDPALRQSISLLAEQSYQVTLTPASLSLTPGMVRTLTVTVSPANTVDGSVVWASSEPRTATVDQNGTVTAIQPGTAVISATSTAGAVGTCTILVSDSPLL